MNVKAKHIVEKSPGVEYEYDLYEFEASGLTYVARSYAGEPGEAHFLRKQIDGRIEQLAETDIRNPLFREAVAHLRSQGKAQVRYLSGEAGSYLALES